MIDARAAATTAGMAVERAAAAMENAPLHVKAMAGKELHMLADALRAIQWAQLKLIEAIEGGSRGE